MRCRSPWITASLLAVAIVLAGCGADRQRVEAASELLPVAEPLVEIASIESGNGSGNAEEATVGSASSSEDPFAVINLLAPAFSGPGIETYTTSCDPFEDPYGACL